MQLSCRGPYPLHTNTHFFLMVSSIIQCASVWCASCNDVRLMDRYSNIVSKYFHVFHFICMVIFLHNFKCVDTSHLCSCDLRFFKGELSESIYIYWSYSNIIEDGAVLRNWSQYVNLLGFQYSKTGIQNDDFFNKHSASGPGFTSRPNLYATRFLIKNRTWNGCSVCPFLIPINISSIFPV